MRAIILNLLLAVVITSSSYAATIWSETFETDGQGSRYTASTPFSNGIDDHWNRTDGANISNVNGAYSGYHGTYFWAAEDTDDAGGSGFDEQTNVFNTVDISNYTGLQFIGLFGAGNDGGTSGYDSTDYMIVEYSVDGGAYVDGLDFRYDRANNTSYNGGIALDTNDDGIGDGAALDQELSSHSFSIPDGENVQIRIRIHVDSDAEELAFDQLEISGSSDPTSSGIDLRAYEAAEGVMVEFTAYDVESEGRIRLALLDESGTVVWDGSVQAVPGDEFIARFTVPGLEIGNVYDFRICDEVGTWWSATQVPVTRFKAALTQMTVSGVTISFDSSIGETYAIQWTAELGTEWETVDTVTASNSQTSVIVSCPEGACGGFFRAAVQ